MNGQGCDRIRPGDIPGGKGWAAGGISEREEATEESRARSRREALEKPQGPRVRLWGSLVSARPRLSSASESGATIFAYSVVSAFFSRPEIYPLGDRVREEDNEVLAERE